MAYSNTISIPMAYKDGLKTLQRLATSLQRRAVKKRPAETGMDKKACEDWQRGEPTVEDRRNCSSVENGDSSSRKRRASPVDKS